MARLVSVLGASRKFWEGTVDGKRLTVRWGRIGSAGQSKTKSFSDGAAAMRELNRLLAEKRGKGYVADRGSSRPSKGAPPAGRPTAKAYRALVLARLKELEPKLIEELQKRIFPRKFPAGTKSLDYEIFYDGLCGPLPIVGYLMDGNNGQVMIRASNKTVVLAPNVDVLPSIDPVIAASVVERFEDAGVETTNIETPLVRAWFIEAWRAAGGKRLFPLPASIQTHDGGTRFELPSAAPK